MMKTDLYVKVVLTVIAACLIALTVNSFTPALRAASGSTTCKGELKANAWGGTAATLGGYEVKLECD
jgi:hypothetical protein